MAVVNSVEQYLWYEVVATLEVVIGLVNGEKSSKKSWSLQLERLKKAFNLFMLDLEVEDFKNMKLFKDLKLPSEQKTRLKKKPKPRRNSGGRSKDVKVGKQLQLFFVKTTKSILLRTIEGMEQFTHWVTDLMFGEATDFENKSRNSSR